LPPELKFHGNGIAEKALLRRAFEGFLPGKALHRPKQKFSQGAGSRDLLAEYANGIIPDDQLKSEREQFANAGIRSKEELLYFRHFHALFGDRIPPGRVGRTRSVTDSELN
jgi:asparagine synthase (glutamine-hydrolysing)